MKSKLIHLISSCIEDIFIFIGLLIMIVTTYKINVVVGSYLLASIFILIGIFISKRPPKY